MNIPSSIFHKTITVVLWLLAVVSGKAKTGSGRWRQRAHGWMRRRGRVSSTQGPPRLLAIEIYAFDRFGEALVHPLFQISLGICTCIDMLDWFVRFVLASIFALVFGRRY